MVAASHLAEPLFVRFAPCVMQDHSPAYLPYEVGLS